MAHHPTKPANVTPTESAVLAALAADSAVITNADVATVPVGSWIRSNGVDYQFVRALFDTAAHAGGIIGTTTESVAVGASTRINGVKTLLFDSAPVVGKTAYGSVTGLGKSTCSIPGTSAVMVPIGTVIADLSVGATYAALVACPSTGLFSPASLRDSLHAEAMALLGGEPNRYHTLFDDFDMLPSSGLPPWGTPSASDALTASTQASCVKIGPKNGAFLDWISLLLWPAGTLIRSIKALISTSTTFYPNYRCGFGLMGADGTNAGICAQSDGNIYLQNGWNLVVASPPEGSLLETLGTVDAAGGYPKRRLDLLLLGDGTFKARFEGGAWTAAHSFVAEGSQIYGLYWGRAVCTGGAGTTYVEHDWIFADIYR